jgi:hypothetical protein
MDEFAILIAGLSLAIVLTGQTNARDDGRYAASPLKSWMDKLSSGNGVCCSFADGISIADIDWNIEGGHYRVWFCRAGLFDSHFPWPAGCASEWIVIPDNAVVTEPNRLGTAVLWPFVDAMGNTQIRCFMPGALG